MSVSLDLHGWPRVYGSVIAGGRQEQHPTLTARRYIDFGEHASPMLYERPPLDFRGMKATSLVYIYTIKARKLNGQ